MNLTQKQEVVQHWNEIFQGASVVILAGYSGLKANDINKVRNECSKVGVDFHVVKNTLIRRALVGTPNELLVEDFRGPIAVAIGIEDQVAPAKALAQAKKEFKSLELMAGALDGNRLDGAAIEALAKMPGRDELRASFLGLLNNVPGGFVRLLNAVPSGMVNVLDAKRRKMEEAA